MVGISGIAIMMKVCLIILAFVLSCNLPLEDAFKQPKPVIDHTEVKNVQDERLKFLLRTFHSQGFEAGFRCSRSGMNPYNFEKTQFENLYRKIVQENRSD